MFLFTFTSFGVVLILGGLRYRTLEVEIWQQTVVFLNLPAAAALAILQLVGVTAVLAWYSRYQERKSVGLELSAEDRNLERPGTFRRRLAVGAAVGCTLAAVSVPLVMLVARSLRGGGAGWRFLADPGVLAITPGRAMANSLWYALATALVAVTVGLCASTVIVSGRSRAARWFDVLLMLPLGASAVTVGFGMLVALDRPVDLRATVVLVPLAHALVATPFVVRTVTPMLRSVGAGLREAASVLGASPWKVFREVDLPIAARATAVGGGFAAAVSLGEFGATAFIAPSRHHHRPGPDLPAAGAPGSGELHGRHGHGRHPGRDGDRTDHGRRPRPPGGAGELLDLLPREVNRPSFPETFYLERIEINGKTWEVRAGGAGICGAACACPSGRASVGGVLFHSGEGEVLV